MNNVNREMKILRKTEKGILEIKENITKMKNAFDGLIKKQAKLED